MQQGLCGGEDTPPPSPRPGGRQLLKCLPAFVCPRELFVDFRCLVNGAEDREGRG